MNSAVKSLEENTMKESVCNLSDGTSSQKQMSSTEFASRHIGPRKTDLQPMLEAVGVASLEDLVSKTVPESIRIKRLLKLAEGCSEVAALSELKQISEKNEIFRSYIGLGYYNCFVPNIILRNITENPGWYTQYTPYQPEISQGRLEALLNFQTMVCDLTKMDVANASLLDEGTAAAEAMTLCMRVQSKIKPEAKKFFVSNNLHPQNIDVVVTRAEPLGIEVICCAPSEVTFDDTFFGAIVQYPGTDGEIENYSSFAKTAHDNSILVIASTDLMSLAILTPPGAWGADVVVGCAQRFGVPLGFGGPHAAFMACRDEFKREIPGRLVGVSKDATGKTAFRLALQTREQHIRREKATSNICTAQVLLSIMSSMYAVYHGPEGIKNISENIHRLTNVLSIALMKLGYKLKHKLFFDTIRTEPLGSSKQELIVARAKELKINYREYSDTSLGISIDETVSLCDLQKIVNSFNTEGQEVGSLEQIFSSTCPLIPKEHLRTDSYLAHPVFNSYHSETEMLRYITRLQSKDLSLAQSMIPLGSCTMKLNATAEMIPVTWPEFSSMHPFAPESQTLGYRELCSGLEAMLEEILGFPTVSLQPNAGSQGEYAGLLSIRNYYLAKGEASRNICLIPASAHGTNPATAALAGMQVVIVKTKENGDVDIQDLIVKAEANKSRLAALMITYPSTHGVFEEQIVEICKIIHDAGAQVYMDGANLNAQVGLCRPGDFGVDVCHVNLHKTFCIPHGGGGPGMGPIGVAKHLAPHIPGHVIVDCGSAKKSGAVSSAPWGSASILPISWMYIKMMGAEGLANATKYAILNANYVAKRLDQYFPVLYKGEEGFVAHECILDLRRLKHAVGVEAGDVAKRLMDYGFHAPTVSFPVVETLMIEPTESESKEELDRFCEAMISIYCEIKEIEDGIADRTDNLLKQAPHTAEVVSADEWTRGYSRTRAAYPLPWVRERKFWPSVSRIDGAYGDRNFCCTCSTTCEE
jgi:glycine dehydrogenase